MEDKSLFPTISLEQLIADDETHDLARQALRDHARKTRIEIQRRLDDPKYDINYLLEYAIEITRDLIELIEEHGNASSEANARGALIQLLLCQGHS